MTTRSPSHLEQVFRRFTLVVTNVIKIGGLLLAFKTASHPPVDPFELALSAFMMSGAELTEATVLRMIRSFLGREETAPAPSEKRNITEHEERE